jgi:hypothetical protein
MHIGEKLAQADAGFILATPYRVVRLDDEASQAEGISWWQELTNAWAFDRHRGSGCPLTPATPPCVRVRTRRFEKLRLLLDQRRKTERFEIGIGKPD